MTVMPKWQSDDPIVIAAAKEMSDIGHLSQWDLADAVARFVAAELDASPLVRNAEQAEALALLSADEWPLEIRGEATKWYDALAEQLLCVHGIGTAGRPLSTGTLRHWRATSLAWTRTDRYASVNFTAHRELNGVANRSHVLDVLTDGGTKGCTEAQVRDWKIDNGLVKGQGKPKSASMVLVDSTRGLVGRLTRRQGDKWVRSTIPAYLRAVAHALEVGDPIDDIRP